MNRTFGLGVGAGLLLAALAVVWPPGKAARRSGGLPAPGAAVPAPAGFSPLASWATIAGCGAAGGSASGPGGGIQWIGRNVTGGLIDAQVLTTRTFARGADFTTLATRLRTALSPKLGIALNVPVLYKAGEVTVLGTTKEAALAGFGDLSVELAYKLGPIGAHQLMLTAIAPTGAHDAVRQGIVLPQHLQLGSGVPGVTAQYQHTRDQDWGLMVMGGTLTYPGPENGIGDYRAPSASVYGHVGYLLGPFVPSAGLLLFGKTQHDRERGFDRPADRDPRFLVVPSFTLEWSSEWLALLPAATVALSPNGFESLTFGLGVASSVF